MLVLEINTFISYVSVKYTYCIVYVNKYFKIRLFKGVISLLARTLLAINNNII